MIPDTQARPGVPDDHLEWAGNYAVDKMPDVIVHLGDHWDLPSLSRHSDGKHELDQQDVDADIEAGNTALLKFSGPIIAENKRRSGRRVPKYTPRKIMLRGNHENRIQRFLEGTGNKRFTGCVSEKKFNDKALGWEVHEFLKPVEIGGIWFAHYFYQPLSGKPYGGTAANKLRNIGHPFVMGHVQGIDMATRCLPNGQTQWGFVVGSFYQHHETYKGPQANGHWRGILMLHEVESGDCNPMVVSMDYLERRYS